MASKKCASEGRPILGGSRRVATEELLVQAPRSGASCVAVRLAPPPPPAYMAGSDALQRAVPVAPMCVGGARRAILDLRVPISTNFGAAGMGSFEGCRACHSAASGRRLRGLGGGAEKRGGGVGGQLGLQRRACLIQREGGLAQAMSLLRQGVGPASAHCVGQSALRNEVRATLSEGRPLAAIAGRTRREMPTVGRIQPDFGPRARPDSANSVRFRPKPTLVRLWSDIGRIRSDLGLFLLRLRPPSQQSQTDI